MGELAMTMTWARPVPATSVTTARPNSPWGRRRRTRSRIVIESARRESPRAPQWARLRARARTERLNRTGSGRPDPDLAHEPAPLDLAPFGRRDRDLATLLAEIVEHRRDGHEPAVPSSQAFHERLELRVQLPIAPEPRSQVGIHDACPAIGLEAVLARRCEAVVVGVWIGPLG